MAAVGSHSGLALPRERSGWDSADDALGLSARWTNRQKAAATCRDHIKRDATIRNTTRCGVPSGFKRLPLPRHLHEARQRTVLSRRIFVRRTSGVSAKTQSSTVHAVQRRNFMVMNGRNGASFPIARMPVMVRSAANPCRP